VPKGFVLGLRPVGRHVHSQKSGSPPEDRWWGTLWSSPNDNVNKSGTNQARPAQYGRVGRGVTPWSSPGGWTGSEPSPRSRS
jgi:hypothetical protein